MLIIPKLTQEMITRFWNNVEVGKLDQCWIWTGSVFNNSIKRNYGRFCIHGQRYSAHRISLAIIGKRDSNKLVCHSCNTPSCVNPNHLRFGTDIDNQRDRKSAQTDNIGTRNGRAKLNESDIPIIRKLAGRVPQKQLCELFNVTRRLIRNIVLGKNWSHITKVATDLEVKNYLKLKESKIEYI